MLAETDRTGGARSKAHRREVGDRPRSAPRCGISAGCGQDWRTSTSPKRWVRSSSRTSAVGTSKQNQPRPRSPPTGRRRRGCSLRRGSGGGSSPAPAAGRRGSSPASSTRAPARPRSTGKPRSAPCTPASCPARPGAQNPPPVGQPRRRDHRHRRQQRRTAGQSYPARLRPPPVPPLAAERHPRGCRVTERSGTNRAPSGGENTRQLNTRSCQYGEQHRPAGQRRTQRRQAGAVPPGAGLRAAPGTGRGRPPCSGRVRLVEAGQAAGRDQGRPRRVARSLAPASRSRGFRGAAGGPGPGQLGHIGDLVVVYHGPGPSK